VSFDGTGYGTDGHIWGGEFLVATEREFERLAHLAYVPMPGGERAIKEPWRMTIACLGERVPELAPEGVEAEKLAAVERMVRDGAPTPLTSSMGRLFDAVSALLGVCTRVSYEGQAAIELEAQTTQPDHVFYPFNLDVTTTPWTIDPRGIVRAALDDLRGGTPRQLIATRFHNTIVEVTRAVCIVARRERGLERVVLSGGCFQNMFLLEHITNRLERDSIPAKIVSIEGSLATVDVMGNRREADVSLVEEPKVGDYVLVHAGFAIEKMSQEDAAESLRLWEEIARAERTAT